MEPSKAGMLRHDLPRIPEPVTPSEQTDNIIYPNDGAQKSTRVAVAGRAHEPNPGQSDTPRRPTSLACCTLAGDGKPHACVWGYCKVGTCPNTTLRSQQVQATNMNASIGSIAREEAGSIKSNLSFQAFRIMEELSRASGLDTNKSSSQPAPTAGKSILPESPPKTPAADTEALYIFSPNHNFTACYLYSAQDGQSKDSYDFEHVPVRVVHGFGRPAYLIAMSSRDTAVGSPEYGAASQDVKGCQSREQPAPDGLPHGDTGTVDHDMDKAEVASMTAHADMVKAMIRRVRDRLQTRNQRRHILPPDDAEEHGTEDKTLYLVSEKDLAEAFELALATLEQACQSGQTSRCNADAGNAPSSHSSLPKLDSHNNAITPCLPAAAEPATTIHVPKTSFSSIGCTLGRGSADSSSLNTTTRSTIVSRRSVAEVVWTGDDSHDQEQLSDRPWRTALRPGWKGDLAAWEALSAGGTLNGHLVHADIDITGCSLHQYAAPGTLENLVAHVSFPTRGSQSTDEESNITSFPELRPRHCTNDWLNPPVEMEQLTRPPSADLYQLGVDAHCGGASKPLPDSRPEEAVGKERHRNVSSFASSVHQDPFYYANAYSFGRRATEGSPFTPTDKRLGSSIGSASRRRRSSHVPGIGGPQPEPVHDGLLPIILERLRTSGQKMFHRHECPKGSDDSEAGTPVNSPTEDEETSGSADVRSRDSLIRERTPEPPKPDVAGIYEAMTGSRMVVGRERHDTCSEDNRPHICENDMESASIRLASPA